MPNSVSSYFSWEGGGGSVMECTEWAARARAHHRTHHHDLVEVSAEQSHVRMAHNHQLAHIWTTQNIFHLRTAIAVIARAGGCLAATRASEAQGMHAYLRRGRQVPEVRDVVGGKVVDVRIGQGPVAVAAETRQQPSPGGRAGLWDGAHHQPVRKAQQRRRPGIPQPALATRHAVGSQSIVADPVLAVGLGGGRGVRSEGRWN